MVKKVLFLPLLQMKSGHHQTADSIIYSFYKTNPHIQCKKVEFLSYVNKALESIVSRSYMKWVASAPQTYSKFYKSMFYSGSTTKYLFKLYESLFLEQMKRLLIEENPDIIVCTHAFPSYLVSRLKTNEQCNIPTVNVYTDFFINDLWGKSSINLHLVPSVEIKYQLIHHHQVNPKQILVSGIIKDERITLSHRRKPPKQPFHLLIAGGSQGVGQIMSYLPSSQNQDMIYTVLCGNNKKLYQELVSLNHHCIRPLPYISKMEQINRLYNMVDAIITKPGGVTMSEAIAKRIPIFIHSTLPGQEEVNLNYLYEKGLIQILFSDKDPMKRVKKTLQDNTFYRRYNQRVDQYFNEKDLQSTADIVEQIIQVASHSGTQKSIEYSIN